MSENGVIRSSGRRGMSEKDGDVQDCIDGKQYWRYRKLIAGVGRKAPALLSSGLDAVKVREWLRENTNGVDDMHWIEHLLTLSYCFTVEEDKKEWLSLDARTRERKIKKIVGVIRKLQVLLSDEALPGIPLVHELLECCFASSWEVSASIREFCKKEGSKTLYEEGIGDLLDGLVCRLEREIRVAKRIRPNNKGDAVARNFARDMFGFLCSISVSRKNIDSVVASVVSLRYPNVVVSDSQVSEWLRKIKRDSN